MTNNKIQVGLYGRTNFGKILIFAYIENFQGERYENKVILSDGKKILDDFYYFKNDEQIVKESKNLIDLIEVGDYVNGDRVIKKHNDYLMVGTEFISQSIPNELIETIVTKEQFEKFEYKL